MVILIAPPARSNRSVLEGPPVVMRPASAGVRSWCLDLPRLAEIADTGADARDRANARNAERLAIRSGTARSASARIARAALHDGSLHCSEVPDRYATESEPLVNPLHGGSGQHVTLFDPQVSGTLAAPATPARSVGRNTRLRRRSRFTFNFLVFFMLFSWAGTDYSG